MTKITNFFQITLIIIYQLLDHKLKVLMKMKSTLMMSHFLTKLQMSNNSVQINTSNPLSKIVWWVIQNLMKTFKFSLKEDFKVQETFFKPWNQRNANFNLTLNRSIKCNHNYKPIENLLFKLYKWDIMNWYYSSIDY